MDELCIYISLYCVLLCTQSTLQSWGGGGGGCSIHSLILWNPEGDICQSVLAVLFHQWTEFVYDLCIIFHIFRSYESAARSFTFTNVCLSDFLGGKWTTCLWSSFSEMNIWMNDALIQCVLCIGVHPKCFTSTVDDTEHRSVGLEWSVHSVLFSRSFPECFSEQSIADRNLVFPYFSLALCIPAVIDSSGGRPSAALRPIEACISSCWPRLHSTTQNCDYGSWLLCLWWR